MKDHLRYFPFDSPREEQKEILDKVLEAISNDKKFILVEAPTGVGKSAISVNLGHFFGAENKKSYILTTQKILQDQYVEDFNNVTSIKGKDNYTCQYYQELNCVESYSLLNKDSDEEKETNHYKTCGNGKCVYRMRRQIFIDANVSMTNLAYFLNETTYARECEYRDLLIIDECHNLEKELMSFVEIGMNSNYAKRTFDIELPSFSTKTQYVTWLKMKLLKKVTFLV